MTNKVTTNQDLENFLVNGNTALAAKPWHGFKPDAKRVGVKAFSVVVNEYEKAIIREAAKKDNNSSAGFIRQAALKRANIILGLE